MRTLVMGGAACGKSALAEGLALAGPAPHVYVATMERAGAQAEARVGRHARLRAGKGFATCECARDLARARLGVPAGTGTALLECLGTLVANEMFEPPAFEPRAEEEVCARVLAGVEGLERAAADVVVVTSDVGRDGRACDASTQAYARVLARVNAVLAGRFERVAEVVFGIPVWVKGGEADGGR